MLFPSQSLITTGYKPKMENDEPEVAGGSEDRELWNALITTHPKEEQRLPHSFTSLTFEQLSFKITYLIINKYGYEEINKLR